MFQDLSASGIKIMCTAFGKDAYHIESDPVLRVLSLMLLQVVQEILPPKGVSGTACGLDYGLYPQASLPQIAHALINDPAMLSALVHFIKVCAAGIPTHWKQPTERCCDAIKVNAARLSLVWSRSRIAAQNHARDCIHRSTI